MHLLRQCIKWAHTVGRNEINEQVEIISKCIRLNRDTPIWGVSLSLAKQFVYAFRKVNVVEMLVHNIFGLVSFSNACRNFRNVYVYNAARYGSLNIVSTLMTLEFNNFALPMKNRNRSFLWNVRNQLVFRYPNLVGVMNWEMFFVFL